MVYFSNRHARTFAKQERIYEVPAERVAQSIKPFVMRHKKKKEVLADARLDEVVYKNELGGQQRLSTSPVTDAEPFEVSDRSSA